MERGIQAKLCRSTGFSAAYFSGIFSGKKRPSWESARDVLAPVTGTSITVWMEKNPDILLKALKESGFIKD
jgi:hypothetical protein